MSRTFDLERHEGDGVTVFPGVTRITVVGENCGIAFERYNFFDGGVEVHIQDDGKTLKVFPLRREGN